MRRDTENGLAMIKIKQEFDESAKKVIANLYIPRVTLFSWDIFTARREFCVLILSASLIFANPRVCVNLFFAELYRCLHGKTIRARGCTRGMHARGTLTRVHCYAKDTYNVERTCAVAVL